MSRYWACFLIILTASILTAACTVTEKTPEPPATQVADSLVKFGQLQKNDGYTEGVSFRETVTVWNCGNPLQRSDSLTEVRTVEKAIDWYIEGEVGADVKASVLAASATINESIASGYTLEVTDRLERSRSLNLPVGPNSSVAYIVEWRPVVWSGFLPFSYQSGESRIEYQYQKIAFGQVKDFRDQTAADCGISPNPPQPDPTAPSSPATPNVPASTPEASALPTPSPNLCSIMIEGEHLREHQVMSIGIGPFAQVSFSDGLAPCSEDWLRANDHFRIQRVRREENPDGCAISDYETNKVWIGTGDQAAIIVNGTEVGTITYITGKQTHGYVAELTLHVGDRICIS